MIRLSVIALALLALTVTAGAQNATPSMPGPALRVSGSWTASGQPDMATLQVSVVTSATSAEAAAAQNAASVGKVLDALRLAMGAGSSVATVSYSLRPDYEYPPNGVPRLRGYVAQNMMKVETGDLNKIGAIIDAAIRAGANEISGVTYSIRNPEKLRTEALTLATREARSKAEALAAANGVKLGALRLIEEGGAPGVVQPLMKTADIGTPIVVGPVTLEATVLLTYDIAR